MLSITTELVSELSELVYEEELAEESRLRTSAESFVERIYIPVLK